MIYLNILHRLCYSIKTAIESKDVKTLERLNTLIPFACDDTELKTLVNDLKDKVRLYLKDKDNSVIKKDYVKFAFYVTKKYLIQQIEKDTGLELQL